MTEEMHSIHSVNGDLNRSARSYSTLSACADTPYTPHQVDRMKRKLRYHFMTPCEKYKAKKRKPWKLAVQVLKILVVTLQVCVLAAQRASFVDFENNTKIALKHLLFKGWDAGYETPPYPAAIGTYALYKTVDVIDHLNYVMINYNKTAEMAVGAYGFPSDQYNLTSKKATLEVVSFKRGKMYPHNATYLLNPDRVYETVTFAAVNNSAGREEYNIKKTLKNNNMTIQINKLHQMFLKFDLTAIHIREKENFAPFETPDCLHIYGKVVYDNTNHDGRMPVRLDLDVVSVQCQDESRVESDDVKERALMVAFDILVMVICLISFVTCIRSLVKATHLYKETKKFFKAHYNHKLSTDEAMRFANFWYIMILISDILTVAGTGLKTAVTFKWLSYYDPCSMLLGTAHVLVWIGVLRYFEYFKKYNVLMLTLKKSFPNVIRFLLCASIFYFAFAFCGWLVLGPYHVKFTNLATAAECLFSLVNGDDMFVTFSMIGENSYPSIWLFSRVYLYSFISLFIYFVLNIFISVIIGTYESIQMYYTDGFPQTYVEKFTEDCVDGPDSPLYRSDAHGHTCSLFTCCIPNRYDHSDDSTNIIA